MTTVWHWLWSLDYNDATAGGAMAFVAFLVFAWAGPHAKR